MRRLERQRSDFDIPIMNRPSDAHPNPQLPHRNRPSALTTSAHGSGAGVRRILSVDLFEAGAVVEIEHDGSIYRLRHTRRGKLILTK